MADPLAPDDFYEFSQPTDVAVSPSGQRVAITVDEFDAQEDERLSSIFVVPADGSREPYRLTRASAASAPTWSPDGSRLAVLAARETDLGRKVDREPAESETAAAEEEDGESDADDAPDDTEGGNDDPEAEPKSQVWVFDLDRGGDARQVTDREEGVREFDWGPDGERIVISARDPTEEQAEELETRREGGPIEIERLQHKADGVGWLDEVKTYLFVVDVDTGEERRLDEAYGAGASEPLAGLQPAWSQGGIAFVTNRTERPDDSMALDLFLVDPEATEPDIEQLTDGDLFVRELAWGPEGQQIAFVAGPPRNWYRPRRIYVADTRDGTVESRTDSLDRTVARQGNPSWVDDEHVLAAFADEGWTRFVRASTADEPERVFEWLPRDRTIGQFDHGGGTVALTISDPEDGIDVYAMPVSALEAGQGDADPTSRLTTLNEGLLEDAVLPTVERVEYENDDGQTVEGITYLPPAFDADETHTSNNGGAEESGEVAANGLPLVVSIHGGPMSYDAPEFRFDLAYLVGQGYAVFKPNYRGSTSYGRDFSEALRGSRGELETDDVTSGVAELVDRGWVNPDRTFITGFSYGGITTAHVLTRVESFAGGAAEHGIYDFYSNFGTDDNHLWHEDEFGLPWEETDTYRDISSLTDVDNIDTPLLITAGENDWRCPPTQAEQLYVSVKKQGVPAKLVIYQDEHHAITDPDRAIHRIETIADWFDEHDPDAGRNES